MRNNIIEIIVAMNSAMIKNKKILHSSESCFIYGIKNCALCYGSAAYYKCDACPLDNKGKLIKILYK